MSKHGAGGWEPVETYTVPGPGFYYGRDFEVTVEVGYNIDDGYYYLRTTAPWAYGDKAEDHAWSTEERAIAEAKRWAAERAEVERLSFERGARNRRIQRAHYAALDTLGVQFVYDWATSEGTQE